MTGEEKAAIMLLSLDEDLAAEVIRNLRPSEIRRVGKYMNRISSIPTDVIQGVAKEFVVMAQEGGGTVVVQEGVTKNIVTKALGEKDAQDILSDVGAARSSDNPIIDKLRDIDPKLLMDFTRYEHPQTIALILANIKSDQAALILESFTPEMQTEVVRRVATIKSVPQEFIEEVARTLEQEIVTGSMNDQVVGGVRTASEILTRMNRSTESAILTSIEGQDPELAGEIRGLMFTFEDVLKLDDRSLQELLREVSSEELAKAMKMVDESLRQKVYKNMSKRGAEMLQEEIEMMPPVRVSEVESSQRNILDITKRLETEGRIVILRGEDADEFV
ncbi:MAG: flagellar motor switch protein FliG [Syntrophaceae bacterium]|nr:flagellar motor switch protein FliG [Syntrophaceae bacterium]